MTTATATRRRSHYDDAGEFDISSEAFPDRGCAIAPRCLACPLRCCLEEMSREERRIVREVWLDQPFRRRWRKRPAA
jgi:hypothetical protein